MQRGNNSESSDDALIKKYLVAQKYYWESKQKSSLEILNEILKLNPNFIPALKLKVFLLDDIGQRDEAIKLLKKLKEIGNDSLDNNLILYMFLDLERKYEEAESILKYSLEKWPDDINVKKAWMEFLFEQCRFSDAQKEANEILSLKWNEAAEENISAKKSAEEMLKKIELKKVEQFKNN
jgi:tetratricopeptide (TPR) repeat protein